MALEITEAEAELRTMWDSLGAAEIEALSFDIKEYIERLRALPLLKRGEIKFDNSIAPIARNIPYGVTEENIDMVIKLLKEVAVGDYSNAGGKFGCCFDGKTIFHKPRISIKGPKITIDQGYGFAQFVGVINDGYEAVRKLNIEEVIETPNILLAKTKIYPFKVKQKDSPYLGNLKLAHELRTCTVSTRWEMNKKGRKEFVRENIGPITEMSNNMLRVKIKQLGE